MIVTIDGPAGAGKSSVARELARRLGFRFLDTGAMYRTVVLAALRNNSNLHDAKALAKLTRNLKIDVRESSVYLDGQEVTRDIRTMEVTSAVHFVADNLEIRDQLVDLQRRTAAEGDFVTEGRDQGTIVFPRAQCKIFLTASPRERARRRMRDLHTRGEKLEFEEVLRQQNDRDYRDKTRKVGRLIAADDAIRYSTDNKPLAKVVQQLEQIVRERLKITD